MDYNKDFNPGTYSYIDHTLETVTIDMRRYQNNIANQGVYGKFIYIGC